MSLTMVGNEPNRSKKASLIGTGNLGGTVGYFQYGPFLLEFVTTYVQNLRAQGHI
jgi:hypothetical protein